VSLEVSPRLAHDSDGTVAAAHHLWKAVMRPNLMIKVPATRAGIAAIERLVADGINVNATLLFSPQRYEEVARAYLRGLERCVYPEGVASVASVFVSRIDAKLDPLLARIDRPEARALEGQVAVANGKLIYQRFHELFAAALAANRTVQRPLWASTGTKNPHYSDVLYVETLIGAHTVATLPQDTLAAFVNHGQVRATLAADAAGARRTLAALAELGVDFATIAEELEREGVAKFVAAYDDTLAALAEKRRALTGRAMVGA
jgi:transaldolase